MNGMAILGAARRAVVVAAHWPHDPRESAGTPRYAIIAVAALAMALAACAYIKPAHAGPYPKARNYMSQRGYDRWQQHVKTGRWS
jgi:hypothetical protein